MLQIVKYQQMDIQDSLMSKNGGHKMTINLSETSQMRKTNLLMQ